MGQDILSDTARNELKEEASKHDSFESFLAKVKGWAMDVWRQEPADGLTSETSDELSEAAAVHDTPTNWMQAMGHQAEIAWSRVRRDNDPEVPGDHLHGTHQPVHRNVFDSAGDGVVMTSPLSVEEDAGVNQVKVTDQKKADEDRYPARKVDMQKPAEGEPTQVVVTGVDQQVSEPTGVPSGALGDLSQPQEQDEVPSYDANGTPLNEAARAAQRRSEEQGYGVQGLVPPSSR